MSQNNTQRQEHDRIRVLFVCHGNICRSAMAQCVMQHLVDERGLGERFEIDSAATTSEELGNPIDRRARRELDARGIRVVPHRARRIGPDEDGRWDVIACMDEENMAHLRRILGPSPAVAPRKLMSWTGSPRDVEDPWYSGDFAGCYRDVSAGCEALLEELLEGASEK